MTLTRNQLIALALLALMLVVMALTLQWLTLDWSYNRGRTDLYAMLMQLKVSADSAVKWCPIPGGH